MPSSRADAFHAQDSAELVVWFKSVGLDMYSDLVEEKMLTGERLAEMVSEDSCHQWVVSYSSRQSPHESKLQLHTIRTNPAFLLASHYTVSR